MNEGPCTQQERRGTFYAIGEKRRVILTERANERADVSAGGRRECLFMSEWSG